MTNMQVQTHCRPSAMECQTLYNEYLNGRPEEMVSRFQGLVISIIRKKLGNDEIWDVVNEVWLSVWASLPNLKQADRLPAFIGSITQKTVCDYLKKFIRNRERHKPLNGSKEPEDSKSDPAVEVTRRECDQRDSKEFRRRLPYCWEYRESLSEELQMTWRMRCHDGYKRKQIAGELGISVRLVDVRLSTIAGELAEVLGQGRVAAPEVREYMCEIYRLLDEMKNAGKH